MPKDFKKMVKAMQANPDVDEPYALATYVWKKTHGGELPKHSKSEVTVNRLEDVIKGLKKKEKAKPKRMDASDKKVRRYPGEEAPYGMFDEYGPDPLYPGEKRLKAAVEAAAQALGPVVDAKPDGLVEGSFKATDRVEVKEGPYKGELGSILSIRGPVIEVRLDSGKTVTVTEDELLIIQ